MVYPYKLSIGKTEKKITATRTLKDGLKPRRPEILGRIFDQGQEKVSGVHLRDASWPILTAAPFT